MLSRNAPPHKRRGALRDDTKHGCVADDLFPFSIKKKTKGGSAGRVTMFSCEREKRCAKSILKIFKKCLNVLALDCRFKTNKQTNKQIAPCKGIQYSLGFWIPPCGFRIPSTRFQYLSVELGFWIPWAVFRIPKPRISNFISKIFVDSGIRIPLIWGEKKEKQTRQPISKGSRSKCTNL